MTIVQSNPFGTLDPATLTGFEQAIHGSLPTDYREFLLRHNGPLVQPMEFNVSDYSDSIHEHFYGLHDVLHRDLRSTYLNSSDEFPSDLMPVAEDGGGNYVCIGLGGRFGSRVYFLDHELYDQSDDTSGVIPIADSFSQFLEGLFEHEDEDDITAQPVSGRYSPSAILPLSDKESLFLKTAWTRALELLDMPVAEDGIIYVEDVFASLVRFQEEAKHLPRAEVSDESVALLGFLFGQLIVWETKWSWGTYDPEPDQTVWCITDPSQQYLILPLRDTSSVFNGTADSLELYFRMIADKKLPPPKKNGFVILSS